MFGEKFKKKYALTDKGVLNTKKGAAWTVVVNLIMMAGICPHTYNYIVYYTRLLRR